MMPMQRLNLVVGSTVAVMNRVTRETAPFTVIEMQKYQGIAVIYGETGRHGIRAGVGVREVTPREGVFAFVPNGWAQEIEQFCDDIGGRLIGMVFTQNTSLINVGQTAVSEEERYYPVINTPMNCWFGPTITLTYLTGSPRPAPGQRDKLMALGREAVDMYLKWRANGCQLPQAAIMQRDIWRTRGN